jgi:hypothetical protein
MEKKKKVEKRKGNGCIILSLFLFFSCSFYNYHTCLIHVKMDTNQYSGLQDETLWECIQSKYEFTKKKSGSHR